MKGEPLMINLTPKNKSGTRLSAAAVTALGSASDATGNPNPGPAGRHRTAIAGMINLLYG